MAEDGLLHLVLRFAALLLLAQKQVLADGQSFRRPGVASHLESQHVSVQLRLDQVQVLSVLLVEHLDPFLGRQGHDLDVVVVQLH